MRLINRKLVLGLGFSLLGVVLGLAVPHLASALGGTIITPSGGTVTLNTGNTKFTDPFTISAGGVTFKTKSTACDDDNMYVCASGDVFHTGEYWYWPTSDGSASDKQVDGKCASALVLAIRQTQGGTALNQSDLYIVSAHPKISAQGGGGCYVQDGDGKAISQKDIEGWGARAVYEKAQIKLTNSVDTVVKDSDVKALNSSNKSENKSIFGSLATEFKWVNSGEIDSIMGGSGPKTRASKKVTDASILKTIQTALGHDDSSTKPYASGYDYYFPSECVNSKNQILALLAVKQGDPGQVTIIHREDGDGGKGYRADSWQGDQQSCLYGENHWNSPNRMWDGGRTENTIVMADVQNATADPGSSTGGSNGSGDTGSTNNAQLDCGGGILNWVICPFITLAQGAAEKLDNYVANMLTTPIDQTFNSNYFKAWNSFRIIGTAVLIIAGLVMVVSQALGFEILDAYTIRKTLPRLLIAVIGMSLSWPLLKFLIEFFNTLGNDTYGLIVGPFMGTTAQISPGIGILSTLLVSGAGIAAFVAFGPAALLMIVSGLLGLLMAFLILLIRQIGISIIVILAPVAIACYVLPNTQKIWKLWHENFTGLMLMFPIVMAFIAAGHAFAQASMSNGGGAHNDLSQIIGVVAYFIPYFLFPLAFRLATGVISTISGMVNDRSKGAFDRMKNVRTNAAADRHQRRMNEQLSNNRFGNIYRRVGAATTPGSGSLGFTPQSRANYNAYRQAHMQHLSAEALKNDGGRAAGEDDATALAVQHGMSRSNFISEYQRTTGHSEQEAREKLALLERGFGAQMGTEAMQVAAYKARASSSTAYNSNPMPKEDGTMETYEEAANRATMERFNEGAHLVSQGLMTSADAVAAGKGNRGRLDISGRGFGSQLTAFDEAVRSIQGGGGGMDAAQAQEYLDGTLQEADPGDMLAGNTRTISSMAPAMMRNLQSAVDAHNQSVANGDSEQTVMYRKQAVDRALGQVAGVQDNLNRTSPQKAAMFADMVNGQVLQARGRDGDLQHTTVREMVNEAATRPAGENGIQTFLEVRKEYGSAGRAQAAGAMDPPAARDE